MANVKVIGMAIKFGYESLKAFRQTLKKFSYKENATTECDKSSSCLQFIQEKMDSILGYIHKKEADIFTIEIQQNLHILLKF